MVLKKERNGNSDNICFIDASKYFTKEKTMNYITDEDIDRIVNAYTERKDIDQFCHIASLQEIEANGYNLNIPRYVDTSEEEPEIDINEVRNNIATIRTEKQNVLNEINKRMKELGLEEV